MEEQFSKFLDKIQLTPNQKNDAKTKYTNVCKSLYREYYDGDYDKDKKFLFGSYKTKTNTRPLSANQDVDVLFKIPKDIYDKYRAYKNNGPSALLQEVRQILKETYTTTDKISAWGKVILVQFASNTHNIEVLPAFELEDGTFIIPNSENEGSWDDFDPRKEVEKFELSNKNTDNLTRKLTQMLKTWIKNTKSLDYPSYRLQNDVIDFLSKEYQEGADYSDYHFLIEDCFKYLKKRYKNDSNLYSHLTTALQRAKDAVIHISNKKPKEASLEYRKIFGENVFPLVAKNPPTTSKARVIVNPSRPYANHKINN